MVATISTYLQDILENICPAVPVSFNLLLNIEFLNSERQCSMKHKDRRQALLLDVNPFMHHVVKWPNIL